MAFLTPALPEYEVEHWVRQPYRERIRLLCQSWAVQGFGVPTASYLFYFIKIVLYAGGWALFVGLTPGSGGLSSIGSWWATPIALEKAVLWTLLFEGLGLGGASGPLTARYFPPFGGFLYFARPGTTRLAPFPSLPFTAGHRRTLVDVGLYVLFVALTVRALVAADLTLGVLLPVIVVLPLLGLRDKTAFLATRAEHYWVLLLVFCFPSDLIAGSKAVQIGLWLWAAASKLTPNFPSVIAVMVSNHPLLRSPRLRKALYRDYPTDLRPSHLAATMAHAGAVVEFGIPISLALAGGGWPTAVAVTVMVCFHLWIISTVPTGVPIEWNIFFIYAGLVLFAKHASVSVFSIHSPLLGAILVTALLVVPLAGNLVPSRFSFLPSMRYYAGNWAASLWLFRKGTMRKLDHGLVKISPSVHDQLRKIYNETMVQFLGSKILTFRAMHLHGRALNDLVPLAVDDVEDYDVNDGELVAGVVLGWNFGDGHLHSEQMLAAVQAQCGFEPGELRCIFIESQPLGRDTMHWRIADAATGRLEEGHVRVSGLRASQPWGSEILVGSVR